MYDKDVNVRLGLHMQALREMRGIPRNVLSLILLPELSAFDAVKTVQRLEEGRDDVASWILPISQALQLTVLEENQWYAAGGILPPHVMAMMLAHPERWGDVMMWLGR